MPKAVFFAAHTLGYTAGFLVVGMVILFWSHGEPRDTAMLETAGRGIAMILLGLMEAALFSLGCAWAGVQRLPGRTWAFAAGAATGVGHIALIILPDAVPPTTDLQRLEQRGYYSAITTAYCFLAPVIAGFLSAWLWKRTR